MIDSAIREQELPEYGMHVAYNRKIFLRTWTSIAKSMLRYDSVLPHDWLSIKVTVRRTVKVPKLPRRESKKELELIRQESRIKRSRRRPSGTGGTKA